MTTKKCQLWLETGGGKTKILLPVNPEKITFTDTAKTDPIFVGGLGDVVIPSGSKSLKISFSSIFPAHYFTGCSTDKLLSPDVYVMLMRYFLREGTVLKFRITRRNTTWTVIIDSFTYSEKGGDVGTYEYSLTFSEYKSVKPKLLDTSRTKGKISVPKQKKTRVSTKTVPKTYTVVGGDCLWNIAKKFYGDGSKYTIIRDANKDLIAKHGADPNMILPGDVLTIPEQR